MRAYIKFCIILLFTISAIGQVQEEINPPNNIKSIIFKGSTDDQFPIVQIGEPIHLEFDDILANEQDYYYKIVHCDYDWQRSRLLKSQYLKGIDNQRITNYSNSYNTLQPYSNYSLTIPNNNISLKVSGNYIIKIYNRGNEIQFSRRFLVYKNIVKVGAQVKRSRDFNYINEKQTVQFNINSTGYRLVNPKKEVKVAIIQNYHWPTALTNITPQYTLGSELVYKYDKETSFYGSNEYFNFDTSDLRAPSSVISRVEQKSLYHHYLFTNNQRNNTSYTYYPDINGNFVVRTLQGSNYSREAEYTQVHFSLPYSSEIGLNDVYIIGKFNNYSLNEENLMTYNENTGLMEATLLIKQGFYNYKYVIVDEENTLNLNTISGNFHFTENNYLILVYYRNFGDLYDSIIGIGSTNSRDITN